LLNKAAFNYNSTTNIAYICITEYLLRNKGTEYYAGYIPWAFQKKRKKLESISHHHHHHHHVPEGLGMLSCSLILKMKLVPPSLPRSISNFYKVHFELFLKFLILICLVHTYLYIYIYTHTHTHTHTQIYSRKIVSKFLYKTSNIYIKLLTYAFETH
jgi:hypothetical protein